MKLEGVALLATAMTPFGKHPDKSLADLAVEAGLGVLREAGIDLRGVGEAYVGSMLAPPMLGLHIMKQLGLTGLPVIAVESASASGLVALREASFAVACGRCEVALALDGPLLPTPAWKLVVEVYDPSRLQASLGQLVQRASDEALREGRSGPRLEAEQAGEQTYYAVRGLPFELHYAYAGGYLVAAPSRALVMKAIRTRESGESLGRSPSFRALFPPDRDAHVSGLVYQNLGRMVGGLLEGPGAGRLTAEQQQAVRQLAGDARPTLLCAYGEERAIRVTGMGGLFDFDATELALPLVLQRMIPSELRPPAAP